MSDLQRWSVKETKDVLNDLDRYIRYLLFVKKNEQAADAVLSDYDDTIAELEAVAGSLALMKNPRYAAKGYRVIRFKKHDYYLIYRVEGDVAVVYQMLHDLQDQEKSIR